MSQEDWLPTLLAAAGDPDIVAKLKKGHKANGKKFKVHADGYNFLPYFSGKTKESPRDSIYYFSADGDLNAVRWNDWKVTFAYTEGDIANGVRVIPGWPRIAHLRADPFEDAQIESPMHLRWMADNMWLFVPVQEKLMEFFGTLESYPFQQGQSLNVDVNYNTIKLQKVMKELEISSPIN